MKVSSIIFCNANCNLPSCGAVHQPSALRREGRNFMHFVQPKYALHISQWPAITLCVTVDVCISYLNMHYTVHGDLPLPSVLLSMSTLHITICITQFTVACHYHLCYCPCLHFISQYALHSSRWPAITLCVTVDVCTSYHNMHYRVHGGLPLPSVLLSMCALHVTICITHFTLTYHYPLCYCRCLHFISKYTLPVSWWLAITLCVSVNFCTSYHNTHYRFHGDLPLPSVLLSMSALHITICITHFTVTCHYPLCYCRCLHFISQYALHISRWPAITLCVTVDVCRSYPNISQF
jgi:hypothetical protein